MITKKNLLEAAAYSDARSEEHGLEEWALQNDIDIDGLMYVARQRALRCAMIMDGQDPRLLSRTEPSDVTLGPEAEAAMTFLTAAVMDGIGIGVSAKKIDYGKGSKIG
jgi:hypothetical protein